MTAQTIAPSDAFVGFDRAGNDDDRKIPVLYGMLGDDGLIRVHCHACGRWHVHNGVGHRVAHCVLGDRGVFSETGYIVALAPGPVEPLCYPTGVYLDRNGDYRSLQREAGEGLQAYRDRIEQRRGTRSRRR